MQQQAQLRRVSLYVVIKVVRYQKSCPIKDGQEAVSHIVRPTFESTKCLAQRLLCFFTSLTHGYKKYVEEASREEAIYSIWRRERETVVF